MSLALWCSGYLSASGEDHPPGAHPKISPRTVRGWTGAGSMVSRLPGELGGMIMATR